MITFQNKGLIDITALTTFGVSVKDNENPIGFFGTGLKYAIAIILRNRGEITIYRGHDKLEFTTKTENVRGKDFDVVCMNGQPLGFTTHMGANWKPWQAYRELHCNTIDEGGTITGGAGQIIDGMTTIIVSGMDEQYADRNNIVLNTVAEPLAAMPEMIVYPMPSSHIYLRGVRVGDLMRPATRTYNFLSGIELTEDRTVKMSHEPLVQVARALMNSSDAELIEHFITAPKDTWESGVDLSWSSAPPSKLFLETVGRVRNDFSRMVNQSALDIFTKHTKTDYLISVVSMDSIQKKQLDRAIAFLAKIGHKIDPNMINICENLGDGILGRALVEQKAILLSTRCFEMGTKYVAGTLWEEHLHIVKGFEDCTRNFQNYLIDQIMTLGERIAGEPI